MPAPSRFRRLAAPLLTLTALLAAAAPATAGPLVSSATSCDDQTFSQPFLRWMDFAYYTPAPQGSFEAGATQWQLAGARLISDNEPFQVSGTVGSRALRVDPGGEATSRAMCVGIEHPTLRFFLRRVGGAATSTLRVDALFEGAVGDVQRLTIATVSGGTAWQPSAPYPVVANLLPLLPGEHTPVAFAFTAQGDSAWAIDDVYVDPYQRR